MCDFALVFTSVLTSVLIVSRYFNQAMAAAAAAAAATWPNQVGMDGRDGGAAAAAAQAHVSLAGWLLIHNFSPILSRSEISLEGSDTLANQLVWNQSTKLEFPALGLSDWASGGNATLLFAPDKSAQLEKITLHHC